MNHVLAYPKRLHNADAQFGARIFHPKTLDGLAEGIAAHPTLPPRPAFGIDAPGLLAVAKATREAKREEFNMNVWCGTKCCAAGHFCKAHPGDDLYLGRKLNSFCDLAPMLRSDPSLGTFNALAARFCITVRDALYLFDSSEYKAYDADGSYIGIGREEVAERIEQFVASNEEGGGL